MNFNTRRWDLKKAPLGMTVADTFSLKVAGFHLAHNRHKCRLAP